MKKYKTNTCRVEPLVVWSSYLFCIFQKIVHVLLEVFFVIRVTAKCHIVMIALTVFIVYFSTSSIVKAEPCVVKVAPFSIWQVMPKLTNGSIKDCEFGFQKAHNIVRPFDWVRINIGKLMMESGNNFLIGLFSFVD